MNIADIMTVCPVGVATIDPNLQKDLVVTNRKYESNQCILS
ncbi:hypothetical protein [Lentibacillus halodurans]|nr:hypothetical protein [Lentibacillus halodurans]